VSPGGGRQAAAAKRAWWTDCYEILEARIRALRATPGGVPEPDKLAQHAREIALVKADQDRFDCGFFIRRRS